MRTILQSKQFKKDFKKISRAGKYDVEDFLFLANLLAEDKVLPERYRDHALSGDWKNYRECHIKPDWLLIYQKQKEILIFARTGSHSKLFE